MENKNNLISLGDLALKSYDLLFDTSVIINHYASNHDPRTIEEKFTQVKECHDFFVSMQNYVKPNGNFYLTPLILEELKKRDSCTFKKFLKRKGSYRNRKALMLSRKIRDTLKEQRKLERVLHDNNKILYLEKDQEIIYRLFYDRNIKLKEKYGLSEPDVNFLISGMALARARGTIVLGSNDKGIRCARRVVLRKESIRSRKVKFFIRENFLDFKKIGG